MVLIDPSFAAFRQMQKHYSRQSLSCSWPDVQSVEVDVDDDLLRMVAEAENREFLLLSRDPLNKFSDPPVTSPFESGGVSPLSSGPSTPTQPDQMETEDILRGVNVVLENTVGSKRRRCDDRCDDGSDDGTGNPRKQTRNSRRAAERAAFRKSKRKE